MCPRRKRRGRGYVCGLGAKGDGGEQPVDGTGGGAGDGWVRLGNGSGGVGGGRCGDAGWDWVGGTWLGDFESSITLGVSWERTKDGMGARALCGRGADAFQDRGQSASLMLALLSPWRLLILMRFLIQLPVPSPLVAALGVVLLTGLIILRAYLPAPTAFCPWICFALAFASPFVLLHQLPERIVKLTTVELVALGAVIFATLEEA